MARPPTTALVLATLALLGAAGLQPVVAQAAAAAASPQSLPGDGGSAAAVLSSSETGAEPPAATPYNDAGEAAAAVAGAANLTQAPAPQPPVHQPESAGLSPNAGVATAPEAASVVSSGEGGGVGPTPVPAGVAGNTGSTGDEVGASQPAPASPIAIALGNSSSGVPAAPAALAEGSRLSCGGAAFDVSADFSAAANPNGPWTYGWASSLGGALQQMVSGRRGDLPRGVTFWQRPNASTGLPDVSHNPTGQALSTGDGRLVWRPGDVEMHPGPKGEYAVVRWTAPSGGTYTVQATFTGMNGWGTTTDVHVSVNGASRVDGLVRGFGQAVDVPPAGWVLGAGDDVDFSVGYGSNGNYFSDSTRLSATIRCSALTPVRQVLAPYNASWDVYDIRLSQPAAEAFCSARGGHLVTLDSEAATRLLVDEVLPLPALSIADVWTGLWSGGPTSTDRAAFRWYSGAPANTYQNWRSGEPNNWLAAEGVCVQAEHLNNAVPGLWNDLPCATPLAFVCESNRAAACASATQELFNNTCVSKCPTGARRNGTTGVCACTIAARELFNSTCVAKCPTGARRNRTTGVCACTSAARELFNSTCVPKCPTGARRNSTTGVCACTSAARELFNNTCVSKCPAGARRNRTTGVCACTSAARELFNNTCVAKCPTGARHDRATGVCACTSAARELFNNTCVPRCTAGVRRNRTTGVCGIVGHRRRALRFYGC